MPTCCASGTAKRKAIRDRPFPAMALRPEQLEIERPCRELARMKAERDILKKAAAYFARDSI